MNITLSAEERIIEKARSWAAAHGTSLNALVRDYLARLGSDADREGAARLFSRNARSGAGRSEAGIRFNRAETYQGSRFDGAE
jgi:hypothetical protein